MKRSGQNIWQVLENMISLGIFKFKGSENKDLPGGDKLPKERRK